MFCLPKTAWPPTQLTRCTFIFDANADLSYEVTILNAEFINYLIDTIAIFQETQCVDFPQGFYRKLLRIEDSDS